MKKYHLVCCTAAFLFLSLLVFAQAGQGRSHIDPINGSQPYTFTNDETNPEYDLYTFHLSRDPGGTFKLKAPKGSLAVYGSTFAPRDVSGIKVNSQSTGDGLLFVATGKKGLHFQYHLTSDPTQANAYKAHVLFPTGQTYSMTVQVNPDRCSSVITPTEGSLREMRDSLSSNDFCLAALTLLSQEIARYTGNGELNKWVLAAIGIFGDRVDVESLQALPGVTTCYVPHFVFICGAARCGVSWDCEGGCNGSTSLPNGGSVTVNGCGECAIVSVEYPE